MARGTELILAADKKKRHTLTPRRVIRTKRKGNTVKNTCVFLGIEIYKLLA